MTSEEFERGKIAFQKYSDNMTKLILSHIGHTRFKVDLEPLNEDDLHCLQIYLGVLN